MTEAGKYGGKINSNEWHEKEIENWHKLFEINNDSREGD